MLSDPNDDMILELAVAAGCRYIVTHNIAEAVLLSDRIVVMTARPGQVREVVDVDIPRPRSLATMGESRFGALSTYIRGMLHNRPDAEAPRPAGA